MGGKKKGGKAKKAKEGDNDTKTEQKRIIDEIHKAEKEDTLGDYPMNLEMAQKLVETENIEFFVLVERLQDINRRLEKDTTHLLAEKEKEDAKIESENVGVKALRDRNLKQRRKAKVQKEDWLGQKSVAIKTTEDQRVEADANMKALRAQYDPKLEEKNQKIAEYMEQKRELTEFISNQDQVESERDFYLNQVKEQKATHDNLIAGIERDRIKQIDKLRKDMLMQIRTVRMKNSVTNEDQLQGTTKLTVIQNMQLTAELDYQSKRTEDLMFRNHEMKGVITNLSKDLEDHKEVEKELAKRSHFCQKVIQKYKQQIEELKKEIEDSDNKFKAETKRQAADTEQQDLMNYLNTRIQQIEQKLQTTQSHLSLQEEEYQALLEKMINIRNRYSKVILLLTEFIESFVEKDPSLLQKQNDIFLDIDAVKEAEDLQEVEPETLVALGLVLLKQLQPYVQDLSDVRHQENYMRKADLSNDNVIHEVENALNQSQGLAELEQRAVHLKMKEDENKLSFNRGGMNSKQRMQYNSSGNIQEYDDNRNVPTRGQTMGMNSQINGGYGVDQLSHIRSSQRSGIQRSDAFQSGMHQYQSTGVNSGLSKREQGYTTHQGPTGAYKSPGVSRLPMVEGAQPQLKQNFMHLRTGNNRSGLHSLDRTRGGVGAGRGQYGPGAATGSQRKDSRLNYNSSSIPYLNKRGGDQSFAPRAGQNGMPVGSHEMQKRPRGYDPVKMGSSGLPSVM